MKNQTQRRLPWLAVMATVCAGVVSVAHANGAGDSSTPSVVRTTHGVVHVNARDYVGLGYGFAYAHATDNFCLMARHLVTVAGAQSKYFGTEGDAAAYVRSDFFARYYFQIDDAARARFKNISPAARELIRGYVAGYNRYLTFPPAPGHASECRGAPWLRPMTVDDMYRMLEEKSVLVSGNRMSEALVAAVPPEKSGAIAAAASVADLDEDIAQYGSNGWAFGRAATGTRYGLLVGNPHFPWIGDNRFYQVHLTIPGELDVMGATIPPLPVVGIGFNKDVAWTHTVSNATRFTVFELALAPGDPKSYLVDGTARPMTPVNVSIEVRLPDGTLKTRSHVFYETAYGPIVSMPVNALVWDAGKAYALADGNRHNVDQIDTWLGIGKSRNVAEIKSALAAKSAMPWINTLAADRHGDALYADISRVPDVSNELLSACKPSPAAAALATTKNIRVLDGAKSSCNWLSASPAPGKGILAAANLPSVVRTDYVANSNDSYWLVNSKFRLQAQSPLSGPAAVEQGLRTRVGLIDIERRLAGKDEFDGNKVTPEIARRMLFANRNYAAMLSLDDVAKLCATKPVTKIANVSVDLAQACSVLAAWDRSDNLASRGAALFREFWFRAEKTPNLYVVKFDANDPINTPRQLDINNDAVANALKTALGEAVVSLKDKGIALDQPLGEIQGVVRNGKKIGVSGGEGALGILNAMRSSPLSATGYTPVHGTSYLQIVTFDAHGPIVDAVLAYDQSLDPKSPYYASQVELFSRGELYRLPFTSKQITADSGYLPVALPDDPVLHGSSAGLSR